MKKDWIESNNTLHKTFEFADFRASLAFVNRIGRIAELLQHHPDIAISYNKVSISTTTHDAGNAITAKDRELVEAIDAIEM